jgi:NAD(P)H dehydrogenase (quinone)
MKHPKILITGATGKTGMATSLELIRKGYPVRALVRRIDARSERLKAAGAEIAVGSLEDLIDLRMSLIGVQRAYFCPPLEPGTLRRAALFAAAAQEARLELVVALSQWLADPIHPSVHSREKWLTEKMLRWIPGVDVVTVNPGWFADNYMAALEPIAQFGLMALPLGNGLNAPPSNEDIAKVIAGALTNPGPHVGKSYRPTGPRLLSPDDIAAIFGKVLRRRVRYQDVPLPLFLKVARSLGVADFVISQLHWFLQDYQRNSFGLGAPTGAVLEVGGSPSEEFEQIVRRYVMASPFAERTLAAKLRASLGLSKGLLARRLDLEAIARRLAIPGIVHAALAADSPEWRQSRGAPASRGVSNAAAEPPAIAVAETPRSSQSYTLQ